MDTHNNQPEAKDNPDSKALGNANASNLEFAIFWGVSVLLYILLQDVIFPFNVIVFLAIQQVYLVRKGRKSFISLFALSALAIVCYAGFIAPLLAQGIQQKPDSTELTQIWKKLPQVMTVANLSLVVAGLGFLFINLFERAGMRFIYKLLLASGISSVIGIIVLAYLAGDEKLIKDYIVYANGILDQIKNIVPSGFPAIPESALVTAFRLFIYALFSSVNFIVLSLSWWLGMFASRRYFKIQDAHPEVARFRIPDRFIWPVIVLLGCILASFAFDVSLIALVSLNLLFIALSVFGIQGLGIIRHFIARSPAMTQAFRYLPFLILILFFTASFLFPLFLVFVSGLGISEIWIRYRDKSEKKVDSN